MCKLLLLVLASLAAPAAMAVDSGDIVIASLQGEVQVTVHGAIRAVRAGAVLELPASVRTGRDGAVELRQGATTVRVGPETLLDFPAPEKRGGPIDVIQQPRGNVFYDVGKRPGRKLRVETPYLVGVVKGTQFSIAAGDDTTTVSLFEGRLEVRAADGDAVVDLKAGEIATRRRGEANIGVMRMDAAGSRTSAIRTPRDLPGRANVSQGELAAEERVALRPFVSIERDTPAAAGATPGSSVSTDVDLRTPAVTVNTEVSVESGANGSTVDARADTSAAGSAVDASVSTTVGTGVDAATSVSTTVGNVVDAATSASVDLGSTGATGAVDAGAAVNVGTATVDVDTGLTIRVHNPITTIDRVVDTAAVNGSVSVNVGAGPVVDLNPPAGPPGLGLGLGLGNEPDLGLDGSEPETDTDSSISDTATDIGNAGNTDVGELLDGLLRRPARR